MRTWLDAKGTLQVTPIWMLFNTSEDDPDVEYLRDYAQGRRSKRRKRSRA